MTDDTDSTPAQETDEMLLQRLGTVLRDADPVPRHVVEAARAVLGLRHLDTELAELTFDSLIDETEYTLRSDHEPRLLTFETPDLRLELQISEHADGVRLLGQLAPRGSGRVEALGASNHPMAETSVGPSGRFVLERLPAGPLSLVCHRPGATPTATQWTHVG